MADAVQRWARRLGAALLILVSTVIAAVLIAMMLASSPWGRSYLRDTVEEALQERLSEPIDIGEVRVYFNGRIEVDSVVIGKPGHPVAFVPTLEAKIDIGEALSGRTRIDYVRVYAPQVDVLALVDSLKLPPPDPEAPPPDIAIASLAVAGGTVKVDDLEINVRKVAASLQITDVVVIPKAELQADVKFREIEGRVDGIASLIGDLLIVRNTSVVSGDASARVHVGTLNLKTFESFAMSSVVAPANDARRIAGAFGAADAVAPLKAGADLPVVVTMLQSEAPLDIFGVIKGTAGNARITAAAHYLASETSPWIEAEVNATGIDPSAMWEGAPKGSAAVALSGHANLGSFAPDAIDVQLSGTAGGSFLGEEIEIKELAVTAKDGAFDGSLVGETGRGTADASLHMTRGKQGWTVHKGSKVTARNLSLGMLGVRGLAGTVTKLTVDAAGPAKQLRVNVGANGRSIRFDQLRVNTVVGSTSVTVDALSVPDKLPTSGGIAVSGFGASYGGESLESVTAQGSFSRLGDHLELAITAKGNRYAKSLVTGVTIERSPRELRVEFDDIALTTTDVEWKGKGGAIAVPTRGGIEVESLGLASVAGSVSADGKLDGELVVEAKDVDFSRVSKITEALFGVSIPVVGKASVTATVRDGGKGASVTGTFEQLGTLEYPQRFAGKLDASVEDGKLTAVISASEKSSGATLTIDAAAAAPRSVFDRAAWARLDASALERAKIDVENVTPQLISAITGKPIDAKGTAAAHVTVEPGATRLTADIGLRDVEVAGMDRLEADLDVSWDASGATVDVVTRRRKRPLVKVSGRVQVPLADAPTRTLEQWRRTAVKGTVRLDRFSLSRLNRLNLVSEPLMGTVNAIVKLSGTAERPVAEIDRATIERMRVAGAQIPKIELGGRADLDTANAWLRVVQRNKGSLDASITARWDDPEKTVVDLTARKLDLRVLRALATDPTHILALSAGTLDARVHLEGDPRQPVGRGRVNLRGGQLLLEGGARRLTQINLDGKFDGDQISVKRLTARSGEGQIEARGVATLSNYIPRTFTLTATTSRFPYAVSGFALSADASAHIDGKVEGGWIRATTTIDSGLIRLTRSGEELHDTGELEDVVYIDDIAAPDEKTKTGGVPPIELIIRTSRPIRVTGKDLVDLRAHTDLTAIFLDGSLTSLNGPVWVADGWVVVFNERYNIVVGRADFSGRVKNPAIDVQISHSFPIADVRVHVYNDVDEPKIALTSDAGHAPAEVITIMLGGDPDAEARSLSEGAKGAGLGAGSLIAKQFASYLPVRLDVVRIHEDGFEIGRRFFGKVLAGYRYRNPEESATTKQNQHEGTLEWNIFRRLVLEARYGDQAIGNADLLYILRF